MLKTNHGARHYIEGYRVAVRGETAIIPVLTKGKEGIVRRVSLNCVRTSPKDRAKKFGP